jgi:glycerate 2-kinase
MIFEKENAVNLFKETLRQAHPSRLIPSILKIDSKQESLTIMNQKVEIPLSRPIYMIGLGKASVEMAEAVSSVLKERLTKGVIITNKDPNKEIDKVEILTGSHPLPDQKSFATTERLIDFATSIPEGALVFNLISGGTSSLLCKPAEGITMGDLQSLYKLLLNSGATIDEINLVRKSVSEVKAGRMLSYFQQCELIDLIISDVPDDNIEDIGSGPTISQSFSYQEVCSVLNKSNLWNRIPDSVKTHLLEKRDLDSFKSEDSPNHHSYTILSSSKVAELAKGIIENSGFNVHMDSQPWSGSINMFEKHILSKAKTYMEDQTKPTALIFYGECSVKVTGDGLGGRNQELALRMIKSLDQFDRNVVFLSAGTDGIDGPTDAAGAVVDQNSFSKASEKGIDINDYLKRNDSYHFFEKLGGHIKKGPTGNNVMDLQFLFIP